MCDPQQCDQIGQFLKVLDDKFSNKSRSNTQSILAFIQNTKIKLKTTVDTFWSIFGKN